VSACNENPARNAQRRRFGSARSSPSSFAQKPLYSREGANLCLVRDGSEIARGHYRQPLDWTDDTVPNARRQLDRLYGALRELDGVTAATGVGAVGDDGHSGLRSISVAGPSLVGIST
jgi:hypothetical protein